MNSGNTPPESERVAQFFQQQKAALRQEFRRRRAQLTSLDRAEKSSAICERLWDLPAIQAAKTVHTYWPLAERGEVDVRPLILRLVERGVRIALPVLVPEDVREPNEPRMHSRTFESEAALSKNLWGVSEPLQSQRVPFSEIDVVIVPALGISRDGYRIGYGKGHYDEFLSGLPVPTVCPVYADCLMEQAPAEPHDVPMSIIVTENESIRPVRT